MTEQAIVASLLNTIKKSLPVVPLDVALWNTDAIAQYLCRDQTTVRERIICLPTFPKAIRLPSEKGKAHPLFKAKEVIEWAERHQEKH